MEKLYLRASISGAPLQQVAKTHEVWGEYGQTMQRIFDHCHSQLQHSGPLRIDLSRKGDSFSVVDASGRRRLLQHPELEDEILDKLNEILEYLNHQQGASSSSSSSSMPQGDRMRQLEELQSSTQHQLQQLTAQVSRTLQDSEELRKERDRLHQELGQVRAELADLRSAQAAGAKLEGGQEVAALLREELRGANEASREQLEAITKRFTEALEQRDQQELAELKKELLQLREERAAFLSSLSSIALNLQKGDGGAAAEQIQQLLAEQKRSNEEVAGLLREILAALRKGEGAQEELVGRLVSAIEKMGGGLDAFRAAIEESRDRIQRLEEEVAKLKGVPGLSEQLQRNHEEMVRSVRGLHASVLCGFRNNHVLLVRINRTIDELARQIAELNAKIGALQLTTTVVEEKIEEREERPKPTSSSLPSSSTPESGSVYSEARIKKLAESWMGKAYMRQVDELLFLQKKRLAEVSVLEDRIAVLEETRARLGDLAVAQQAVKESEAEVKRLTKKNPSREERKVLVAAQAVRGKKQAELSKIVEAQSSVNQAKAEFEKTQAELDQIPRVVRDLIALHTHDLLQTVNSVEVAAKILGIGKIEQLESIRSANPPEKAKIMTAAGELTKQVAHRRHGEVKDKAAVSKEIRRYFGEES